MASSRKMNLLLLGVIVISVLSASYYLFVYVGQETPPQDVDDTDGSQEIIVGVLAAYEADVPSYMVIAGYAEEQINEYCNASGLPFEFRFWVNHANGYAAGALERVQSWSEVGLKLVAGPPWSSMFCPTRQFADQNGMIVMSHESTSPILCVDDHGYRLTIHDWKEAQIFQNLFEENQVEAVVCLKRADSWGEGLEIELAEKFDGEIVSMGYPGETAYFDFELGWAEEKAQTLIDRYGENHVAVLALSFKEIVDILNQTDAFPLLQRLPWYGPGYVNDEWPAEIGGIAASLNLTSFAPLMPESPALEELDSLYIDEFGVNVGFYEANLYDVCWVLALSALEAGSDDASAMREVILEVAARYRGVTGNCTLDQYGDRNIGLYGIYRCEMVDGEFQWSLADECLMEFQEVYYREGNH